VPPSSLARRPRAPGLDAELERHYPLDARRSGISGTASLRVRLLADGRVGEVHLVSESWTGFGLACERTVRAARWEPPIDREGTPVATEITYTCRFEVRS
jgi:protein TonB